MVCSRLFSHVPRLIAAFGEAKRSLVWHESSWRCLFTTPYTQCGTAGLAKTTAGTKNIGKDQIHCPMHLPIEDTCYNVSQAFKSDCDTCAGLRREGIRPQENKKEHTGEWRQSRVSIMMSNTISSKEFTISLYGPVLRKYERKIILSVLEHGSSGRRNLY